MTKVVAVTGATSPIGRKLVQSLSENGYSVVAVHQKTSDLTGLVDLKNVSFKCSDINDFDNIRESFEDCQTVFHLAAISSKTDVPNWQYQRVNTMGTNTVVNAAIKSGVRKFVHCSTSSVYGNVHRPVSENHPSNPQDTYSKTKLAAEDLVLASFKRLGLQGAILRPVKIWGAGLKNIKNLLNRIHNEKLPIIGSSNKLHHMVTFEDLVNVMMEIDKTERPSNQIYNIAGEKPITTRELFTAIASSLNVSVPNYRMPLFPVYALCLVLDQLHTALGKPTSRFSRKVSFFSSGTAVITDKARKELNFKPSKTTLDEIEDIVGDYLKS